MKAPPTAGTGKGNGHENGGPMADTSLAAISKMIVATSESKESADKAFAQFARIDNAANLIFDKLFNQQTTESQHARRH